MDKARLDTFGAKSLSINRARTPYRRMKRSNVSLLIGDKISKYKAKRNLQVCVCMQEVSYLELENEFLI